MTYSSRFLLGDEAEDHEAADPVAAAAHRDVVDAVAVGVEDLHHLVRLEAEVARR